MASLTEQLEVERQRLQEQEKRMRQADCESRAASMSWTDEKQRLIASLQSVEAQLAVLEDAKEKEKATQRPARGLYKKNLDDDSSNSSDSVVIVMTEEEVRIACTVLRCTVLHYRQNEALLSFVLLSNK